jgi:hypothetical protein
MSSFADTTLGRPPAATSSTFAGALCLAGYWSVLLALRVLVFEAMFKAQGAADQELGFLLAGYTTVAITVVAEVAFFLLSSAGVVIGLRFFGAKQTAKTVMAALALAHAPQLVWAVGAIAFVAAGDTTSSFTGALPAPLELMRKVSMLTTVVLAPELLHRIAGVERRPAMVVVGTVAAVVAAVLVLNGA